MFQARILGQWTSWTGSQKVGMLMPEEDRTDLAAMKELLEAGEVTPVIDRRYSFAEIPEAIRYLEQGHARAKVVVYMDGTTSLDQTDSS